ncbi:uncharacterized protein LOC119071192 isoform X2 [Bradysia coprophila]|nr:uncharacterized protein LOC119071192 isoform X2 [Bradysia coprophila]XP_037031864.1 uncharacterized protein LOC119071192 isoform X2 [Bradysia coprophila]XP_037031865.1 uncharacterized protein LOC119071192 isoform X2 [Bradysia coprophila]XP_037031866.1 uncharacterized protein LOC119071192 isoform X2 [Bradysia coprophila]XP_037031867.1 uncharacterized protein LOC119071192 isoform X2 [Bradysia coprophila]
MERVASITQSSSRDSVEKNHELEFQDEEEICTDDTKTICTENQINDLIIASEVNKMLLARNYWPIGVIIRLVLPLVKGVARGWIRGWQEIRGTNALRLLKNVRPSRQLLTNLFAFTANSLSLGLSSVQVVYKIDPLLKMIKLRNRQTVPKISIPHQVVQQSDNVPEKCVSLNILAQPESGPIRADVIFIHGLHGSLVNTWKQGLWNSQGRRVRREFKRPPKPPIRPPKRQRHSRSSLFDSPHSSKRRRFCASNSMDSDIADSTERPILERDCSIDYSYDCDNTNDDTVVSYLEEIEYNFSTFRMRMDDMDEDKSVPDNDEETIRNEQLPPHTNSSYSKCWPGDWLPLDCPGVRVISLNYTTDPYLWRPVWIKKRIRSSLAERSREMMKMLTEIGVGSGHPIVWVGHSKGGIFIKQMIVDAWECGKAVMAPIWQQSRGILFYSVPHRGSPLADFNLPLLRQSIELTEIKKNCTGLLELHRRFVALYRSGQLKLDVFSFVETALTLMSVMYLRIVGIDSADPGIGEVCGVHLDHREICKPTSRECILYTKLTKMINKVS